MYSISFKKLSVATFFLCMLSILAGGCPPAMPMPTGNSYGNGSAGDIVASGAAVLGTTIAANGNYQFGNFTVEAGAVLFVPSGAILRCNGTFTNNGTVLVVPVASTSGGGHFGDGTDGAEEPPAAGVSGDAATSGEIGNETALRAGGRGGSGLTVNEARNIFLPGIIGGGGGAGATGGLGGAGGGTVVVLAQTAIVNAAGAAITANGADGGGAGRGGGAGGVIVLASSGSATNNGSIVANGGVGGASDSSRGPAGGGGGGIVHLISPTIVVGAVTVNGGAAGAQGGPGSITTIQRVGGGGGGGCGGSGGNAGSVTDGLPGTPGAAFGGFAGHSVQTSTDPLLLY